MRPTGNRWRLSFVCFISIRGKSRGRRPRDTSRRHRMKASRIVVVAALLAMGAAGAALAGVVATGGTSTTRVTGTEREDRLKLSRTHLAAGKDTLVAGHKGTLSHSVRVTGPGMKNRAVHGAMKP